MPEKVVVTGYGVICANASNKAELAKALWAGRSGLKECSAFSTEGLATKYFGEVEEIPVGADRYRYLMEQCAREMLADAGVTATEISHWGTRCKLFFGTLIFSAESFLTYSRARREGREEHCLALMHSYATYLKKLTGVKGTVTVVSVACASGTTAVGMALEYLRSGLSDAAVVGGVDNLSLFTACGFNALHSLSQEVCNPFAKERDGINIGEGGALFLLETERHAKERGAQILAEIAGYSLSNDAYHITSPEPQGTNALRTMRLALKDAIVAAQDVDCVNAHGTGTVINDAMEERALSMLYAEGSAPLPVSTTKALVGHCMGASGAIELASVLLAMKESKYIPLPRLKNCLHTGNSLRFSPTTFNCPTQIALSNSFAFGGGNAVLVVRKYEG